MTIRSSWPERLAHLAEPRQLELEVEVLGQEQVAQVLQLGDELFHLGLGLAELRVLQELVCLPHLFEDLLLAGELQRQTEPRGVLRLEPAQRLGEPEHPLLQLVHLGRDVFLAESDRVAIGPGAALLVVSVVFFSSSTTAAALPVAFFAWASAGRDMTLPVMTIKTARWAIVPKQ